MQQRPWNIGWLTAIHEASHCAFDLQAGATIIELWSDGRGEGYCHAQRPTSAAGCLSGYVGEWNLDHDPDELPDAQDFRDSMHLDDVRLAAERLGSDDPDRLLECWIEAKTVLDQCWPAVERIAFALWQRHRLSGAEVERCWRARSIAA